MVYTLYMNDITVQIVYMTRIKDASSLSIDTETSVLKIKTSRVVSPLWVILFFFLTTKWTDI